MSCSLIPEKPILVSPSLAATIGLEEATLLTMLSDLMNHRDTEQRDGYQWLIIDEQSLMSHLPFWNGHDIQRISKSLCDKGIILLSSAPFTQSHELHFAFNESLATTYIETPKAQQKTHVHNTPVHGANRIPPYWQPSDDVMTQIAQRNIPETFAREQLPEFITYWRERDEASHAWGAKFLREVIRAWRNHETHFNREQSAREMNQQWRPSQDAMDVLIKHANINPQFAEDAIPEFVLYWQERGDSSRTWNSKFIQHVRRQWNRYTATVENDTVPKPIQAHWQPSQDVYDVLKLANIDINFAKGLVQEFVIFWQDSQQVHNSWNTKFLQHAKFHWAKSHNTSPSQTMNNSSSRKTRDRSLVDDLTDRSWAF
ncbi:MAG: DnaT-like ssDNA-binding domain-containing protein [Cellvibrionaceae bacterium]